MSRTGQPGAVDVSREELWFRRREGNADVSRTPFALLAAAVILLGVAVILLARARRSRPE